MQGPEWLTVGEVAALVRVDQSTVRRWIGTRGLPAHRPGQRAIRIRRKELDAFLASSKLTAPSAAPAVEAVA